jgi:ABC-type dipeptide/oligopeptide/nickel transport system permease component
VSNARRHPAARTISFYVVRRLGWAILVCIAAAIMTFLLIRLAPGNPVSILAGDQSTPEYQAALTKQLGLDQPLWIQLVKYLAQLCRGNLGYSFTYHASVASVIASRAAPTLLLMGLTLVISVVGGVLIGVQTAVERRSRLWGVVGLATLVGYSLPAFWLGQVLILIFAVQLGWFPVLGQASDQSSAGFAFIADVAWHLALPVATLATVEVALIARLTRSAMVEALTADYIIAARGKGVGQHRLIYRHALRNALLPVVTVIGLELGWLVAGFVVVETVFSWPGLGTLTYAAIDARDYPVITGLFLVITVSVVLANLLTDLVYLAIDPRMRVE